MKRFILFIILIFLSINTQFCDSSENNRHYDFFENQTAPSSKIENVKPRYTLEPFLLRIENCQGSVGISIDAVNVSWSYQEFWHEIEDTVYIDFIYSDTDIQHNNMEDLPDQSFHLIIRYENYSDKYKVIIDSLNNFKEIIIPDLYNQSNLTKVVDLKDFPSDIIGQVYIERFDPKRDDYIMLSKDFGYFQHGYKTSEEMEKEFNYIQKEIEGLARIYVLEPGVYRCQNLPVVKSQFESGISYNLSFRGSVVCYIQMLVEPTEKNIRKVKKALRRYKLWRFDK